MLNLADEMTARGWLLQPQPPFAQPGGDLPATLHLTVTGATAGRVPALLADLAAAARAAAALPRPVADPDLVAAAATIDPATLTVAEVDALLEIAGVGGGRLPERMAPVHALVAALPRPVAERLLSGVLTWSTARSAGDALAAAHAATAVATASATRRSSGLGTT